MNITLPSIDKSKVLQKPKIIETSRKLYEYFSTRIPKSHIETILKVVKDERFLFFIKYGALRRYDCDSGVIYVEIPQIPKKLVVYRLPNARSKALERFNLSKKDLPHIPLFEGEENLKYLTLEMNQITKIDNLISLNSLIYLNLYCNKILEIENLQTIPKLKVLLLGKNKIDKIKNLHYLYDLEILDLHSNKIMQIENLSQLKKLRILNLANNQITSFNDLVYNRNLEELNIRKNLIGTIPNLTNNLEKLRRLNIEKNLISRWEYLHELTKLKALTELIIDDNPVFMIKEAFEYTKKLPLNNRFIQLIQKQNIISNLSIISNHKLIQSQNLPQMKNFPMKQMELNVNNSLQLQKREQNEIQSKNIVKPIKILWDDEYKKLINMGYNGYLNKKYKDFDINNGHVELEGETKMLIYGDALNALLHEDFQNKIVSIYFNYYYYDVIVCKSNIELLKKFKKLNSIGFCNNNLFSFYQVLKLENILTLENVSIENNEINNSSMLKFFLIYRIQNLKMVNERDINEEDVFKSKKYFEFFDKCISNKEKKKEEKKKLALIDTKSTQCSEVCKNDIISDNKKFKFFTFVKKNMHLAIKEIIDDYYKEEE